MIHELYQYFLRTFAKLPLNIKETGRQLRKELGSRFREAPGASKKVVAELSFDILLFVGSFFDKVTKVSCR
jgi:hypothetical protein